MKYRLPDGSVTNDEQEYFRLWKELCDKLETKYVPMVIIGFGDRYISFGSKIPSVYEKNYCIPSWLALEMVKE